MAPFSFMSWSGSKVGYTSGIHTGLIARGWGGGGGCIVKKRLAACK